MLNSHFPGVSCTQKFFLAGRLCKDLAKQSCQMLELPFLAWAAPKLCSNLEALKAVRGRGDVNQSGWELRVSV